MILRQYFPDSGTTGGASDIVKAESSGEDPRATGGLVSNLPHPRVNKTKQYTPLPMACAWSRSLSFFCALVCDLLPSVTGDV